MAHKNAKYQKLFTKLAVSLLSFTDHFFHSQCVYFFDLEGFFINKQFRCIFTSQLISEGGGWVRGRTAHVTAGAASPGESSRACRRSKTARSSLFVTAHAMAPRGPHPGSLAMGSSARLGMQGLGRW